MVSIPAIVDTYKKFIGGVDLLDPVDGIRTFGGTPQQKRLEKTQDQPDTHGPAKVSG